MQELGIFFPTLAFFCCLYLRLTLLNIKKVDTFHKVSTLYYTDVIL